ncbi:hypothetical protein K1719_044353 [Acacia pycnantha]|nr:hypothetical protein K1719_044353 [Acacia pycnantha]
MIAPMVNAVTAMIEELRRLIREELREVSDGVNSKLANILSGNFRSSSRRHSSRQHSSFWHSSRRAHHATIGTGRRMRFGVGSIPA